MTKKILHSIDEKSSVKEFLIPVSSGSGFSLVGLKTGMKHTRGIVVFTGKELCPKEIDLKAKANDISSEIEVLSQYLKQIPKFKISKEIQLKESSELLLENCI